MSTISSILHFCYRNKHTFNVNFTFMEIWSEQNRTYFPAWTKPLFNSVQVVSIMGIYRIFIESQWFLTLLWFRPLWEIGKSYSFYAHKKLHINKVLLKILGVLRLLETFLRVPQNPDLKKWNSSNNQWSSSMQFNH